MANNENNNVTPDGDQVEQKSSPDNVIKTPSLARNIEQRKALDGVNTDLSSSSDYISNKKILDKFKKIREKNIRDYYISFFVKVSTYLFILSLIYLQTLGPYLHDYSTNMVLAIIYLVILILYLKQKKNFYRANKYHIVVENIGVTLCGVLFGLGLLNISVFGLNLTYAAIVLFFIGNGIEFLFSFMNASSKFSKVFYTFMMLCAFFNAVLNLYPCGAIIPNFLGIDPYVMHAISFILILFSMFILCFTNERVEYNHYGRETKLFQFLPSIMFFETNDYAMLKKSSDDRLRRYVMKHSKNEISDYMKSQSKRSHGFYEQIKANSLVSSGEMTISLSTDDSDNPKLVKKDGGAPGVNAKSLQSIDENNPSSGDDDGVKVSKQEVNK